MSELLIALALVCQTPVQSSQLKCIAEIMRCIPSTHFKGKAKYEAWAKCIEIAKPWQPLSF